MARLDAGGIPEDTATKMGWVYGGIVPDEGDIGRTVIYQKEPGMFCVTRYPVDSSTVGQYTGRTDRNGKKIFEGDILKLFDFHGIRTVKLYYDKEHASFRYGGDGLPEDSLCDAMDIEVIGNVFETPGLLGT